MTRMLVAGTIATLLMIVLAPVFIRWLQRKEFGQSIREDGPQGHLLAKAGTPTMGGLLVLFCASVPYFIFAPERFAPGPGPLSHPDYTKAGLLVWATMILCALIGFWDDWMKISNKRSLGLSGKKKMLALAVVTAFLGWAAHSQMNIQPVISIPFSSIEWDIGYAYYPFLFLLLAGFSNAVNLTDGLDGLAAGTVTIALMSYLGIAFILWERNLATALPLTLGGNGAQDIAILCAALAGALVGFLWYNAFPARIFMGDTGSMALGGALAALSVVTKTELLLGIIGGIFVVEAVSVTLQVFVFKRTGKRLFLMAPIHHHFELKNWSETQIMVRFWIVAGMFGAAGFTIWFQTH